MTMLLKFPPLLAGNGSLESYLVLALILALVIGVLFFVFRLLNREAADLD